MRKKLVFMLMLVMAITALPLHAQNAGAKLTMSFDNEPLSQVFLRLEQSSTYKFLFTYDDVNKYKVTGKMRNATVLEIVDFALKNTPLEYNVNGKFINVTLKSDKNRQGSASLRTYGGYVFDENNEPVIGAQVKVVGDGVPSNVVTVTDLNGAFSFDYAFTGQPQVQISYVGLQTVTLPLRQGMKVIMKEDSKALGEVVVTGIFRKAKESYTGSVSTITSDQLEMYRGQNLLQTLKNVDASINFAVNNIMGSNPNNLPSINIRGNASVPTDLKEFNEENRNSANTPLIILDGFEITLERLMDYNDEEIETINILKDAAATAIYGSRGANGVIVVSTKKPEAGRLRVSAEAGMVVEVPDLTSYHLLNASQKLELEKQIGAYSDPNASTYNRLQGVYNERRRAVASGVDTDWLAKPLRTGLGQEYKLRLEGGSKEFRWGASASYKETAGAMKDSNRKVFNGGITLLYQLKNVTFRNYTNVGITNSRESKYGTFSDYVTMEPYDSPYDENGVMNRTFRWGVNSSTIANPLYDATLNSFDKSEYQNLSNQFSIEWRPVEEFIFRGQLGLTTQRSSSDKFVSPYSGKFRSQEYTSEEGMLRKGTYDYGTGRSNTIEANLTASYNKTFADVHSLYAGLDWSITQSKSSNYFFAMEGFSTDRITSMATAQQYAEGSVPSGSENFYRRMGITGNLNYTYDNRYYADFSYRMDGNSNFGSDKKFAPFWSAGIGWSLHNEKYFKAHQDVVNQLRLKLSYGQTGTQLTSRTGAISTYQYVTSARYLSWAGAQLQGWGNTNLTWQKTDEFNAGLEFGLWNNRVKGTFDIYTKKTSDLLSNMDLPLSTGFSNYLANVGEVENKGWEATASVYVIRDRRRDFNWILSGQLVYNKNKITKLSADIEAQNQAYLNEGVEVAKLMTVGRPTNAIYGVRSHGIDPSTGDEIFVDRNGNLVSEWSAKDIVYLGDADPSYRGIISSLLRWKGWSLNLSFSCYWGGQVYNSTLRDRVEILYARIPETNVDERVLLNRWMKPGDVTQFKGITNGYTRASSRFVQDDRVLEFQSASLQYKWDSKYLKDVLNLQSIIFAINANDLYHWGSVKMERGTSYPYARNIIGSVKLLF